MPDIPATFLVLYAIVLVYGVTLASIGDRPSLPLVLRWTYTAWDFIAYSWRRPAPAPPRPDYARIDQLERELGLVEERPIRTGRTVCLTKNCTGETEEIRTWSGRLIRNIHSCTSADSDPGSF
ncbi:hypothetical protein AB0896_27340 [Streptomyces parvulus]|uniref:hypothetical protein n=1 Tax=Streptomyces parvulus TaxID=146923 RepID=UPI0034537217